MRCAVTTASSAVRRRVDRPRRLHQSVRSAQPIHLAQAVQSTHYELVLKLLFGVGSVRIALGILCSLPFFVLASAPAEERGAEHREYRSGRDSHHDDDRRESHDRRDDVRSKYQHDRWHDRSKYEHRRHEESHRSESRHRVEEYRHESSQRSGLHELSRSVNSELLDIAGAIRSLDQSYYYSGFRNGNHAWVAGSSYLEPSRLDRLEIRRLEQRIEELERRRRVEHDHREERHERAVCETCVSIDWRAGEKLDAERRGRAHIDRRGHLHLTGGSVVLRHGADDLVAACRESNELAVEAVFVAATDDARGPARILSCSTDASTRNFTLGQEGDRLVFRLRTTETDENGTKPEVSLVKIEPGKRFHVVVSYRPGRVVCHLNGEQVMATGAVEGTFANWTEQSIVLGDELDGDRDWAGKIERFSLRSCIDEHGRRGDRDER